MRKNESDLIRKKLKETILKMTPYQQDLMLVAVEKMKKKELPNQTHTKAKSRSKGQLFLVGMGFCMGFCMGFLKNSKTEHNPFLFKNRKYKAKTAQIKRFKRLMLDCVDEKDARYPKARFTKLQTNGSVCGLKRKNRRMSI